MPKPPKKNLAKKFIFNRVVLKFICRKISKDPIDNEKVFLMSFYCGDDSIMLYLKTDKNSGIK